MEPPHPPPPGVLPKVTRPVTGQTLSKIDLRHSKGSREVGKLESPRQPGRRLSGRTHKKLEGLRGELTQGLSPPAPRSVALLTSGLNNSSSGHTFCPSCFRLEGSPEPRPWLRTWALPPEAPLQHLPIVWPWAASYSTSD